jgi:ubiquinone/menaquinone biosynthesis C-methylase UbiE
MGLYRDHIFPYMLEWLLGNRQAMEFRRRTLADARGNVLEIGFGTGLNLSCYPPAVDRLTLIDPERLLAKRVAKRIAEAPFPVEMAFLDAAHLPFAEHSFDTVVSTWTLCTVPEVQHAMTEIHRVLRPGGNFLFLEHGRSDDPAVVRRQDRWNGLQRLIGCGCNLNRPIDEIVASSGMRIETLDRFEMPRTPRIGSHHYLGVARSA